MAIQQHTVQLKLRDDDWKTLGVSRVQPGTVTCSLDLVEGTDFEIDYHVGLVRRLRELPEDCTGLCAFSFDYDDRAEELAVAAVETERLRQQLIDLAQSAVGVALKDLTTAQRAALTACLLFKAGGVTRDSKVKPLAEWLK